MIFLNFYYQLGPVDLAALLLKVVYGLSSIILIIYGLNCYTYVYLFLKNRKKSEDANSKFLGDFYAHFNEKDLPPVTTQLPIYNEKYVAFRLIDAVAQMDYPKHLHEIQILDDSTDETWSLVESHIEPMRQAGHLIKHIGRTDRKDYKAGALENGLHLSSGEFLAIFDSDFVPPPEFLKKTVPFLMKQPKLGFVQTRWGHLNQNESSLTRAQAIGIDGHFVIEQTARRWGSLFLNFNGTAGIWRKSAIVDAGGWQGDTLTEDLDLSYRAQLRGWETEYLYDVVCRAEIPADMNAFKSQQFRWAKGSIQTAKKLFSAVWGSPASIYKKFQSTIHLTHYMIHPLIVLNALLSLPIIFWTEQMTFQPKYIALFAVLGLATFAPTLMYIVSQWGQGGPWLRRLKAMPTLMVIGLGIGVNNSHAVLSALFGSKGDFIRTPKTGAVTLNKEVKRAKKKDYTLKWNAVVWTELLIGFYCFFSFFFFMKKSLLFSGSFFAAPFLLLYGFGFLTASILSLRHYLQRS